MSFIFTGALLQLWRAYWIYDLASGAALLDLPIYTDGALSVQTVNFVGAYRQELIGAKTWRVTATVQTRKPQAISEASYRFVLNNGGLAAFDRLDYEVNTHLPHAVGA